MIILFGVEMVGKGQMPSPTLTLVGADPGNGALDTRHQTPASKLQSRYVTTL